MQEFPTESTPGDAHSTTIEGKEYDVFKLIQYGNSVKPIRIELADLGEDINEACWVSPGGARFAPRDLLVAFHDLGSWDKIEKVHPDWSGHIDKVRAADLTHPILMYKYNVIDGMHRILKARTGNLPDIYVRVLDRLPEEAIYSL